jgi:oligoribonuclease
MTEKEYAWLDKETTGLNPKKESILEVGIIITDREDNILAEFETLVQPQQKHLDKMNDFVRNMHTESGLLRELEVNDVPSRQEAEVEIAKFLKSRNKEPKHLVPVGNNVQKFDIAFLEEHMPSIPQLMHYRTIDISSLYEALEKRTGEDMRPPKQEAHRALADLQEAIMLLKHWNDLL